MAGPSDKARFYLEQSATELNELERKKIFTRVGCRGHSRNVMFANEWHVGRDQLHSEEALRL
jgi:hypothetical protein